MHSAVLSRRLIALSVFFALASSIAFGAESIIKLKDGTTVRGLIVSEDEKEVQVKVAFGTISYRRSEIESVQGPESSPAGGGESAAELRDVISLKSGDTLTGLVVSETDKDYEFEVIASGSNVSRTLVMRTKVPKKDVASIKQLTGEQRGLAREYIQSTKAQAEEDSLAEADLQIRQRLWPSLKGGGSVQVLEVELEHFRVASNANKEFFRRAAFRLAKVFNAYKHHFGVDRNESQKVRVLIYNSMENYQADVGQGIENPAFYAPDHKLIAAGCDLAKYRQMIDDVKKRHDELNEELQEWRDKIDRARADVRKIVDEWYTQLHKAGKTTSAGKRIMTLIRKQQLEFQLEMMKLEKPAKQIQAEIKKFDRRNELVFDEFTDRMLKTLYHEGFHAFLDQFLFDEDKVKHVPRWLNEGLAQYFENARVEGQRLVLGQEDRSRMAFLRKASWSNRLVPIEDVLTAGAEAYIVDEIGKAETSSLHYTQAWRLVHMIGKEGRLTKENLEEFIDKLMSGSRPLDALPILTGMSNAKLQKNWDDGLDDTIRYDR